ncbi:hypothetical protein BGZ76_004805, partial [Entomortierella beljakovae]
MTVAKIVCILAAFVAYAHSNTPPPSSRNVRIDKGDRVVKESCISWVGVNGVTNLMVSVGTFEV